MLNWKNPGRGARRMMEVMNLIFRNHPDLLRFLFHPENAELRQEAGWLWEEAGCFSSGEQTLIRIALNLWNSFGNVTLWDVIEKLDEENYHSVLAGLRHLRRIDPDAAPLRFRQLKLDISDSVAN